MPRKKEKKTGISRVKSKKLSVQNKPKTKVKNSCKEPEKDNIYY